jgi:ubiquinone biosynthesis protein Coq4
MCIIGEIGLLTIGIALMTVDAQMISLNMGDLRLKCQAILRNYMKYNYILITKGYILLSLHYLGFKYKNLISIWSKIAHN